MHECFLKAAERTKLLNGDRALSYQTFLNEVRNIPGISVPVHGLELHSFPERSETGNTAPDFALLMEANPEDAHHASHPLASLIDRLHLILGCSALWVEFDAEQWDPPNPHPRGLPLIYVSPTTRVSPVIFAEHHLGELLKILRQWLADQQWNGHDIPTYEAIREWLSQLPEDGQIQQFGLAFRNGKVQPRLLFELPEPGAALQLLQEIGAPASLQEQSLEAQMLMAVSYPHQPNKILGLELLADRCSLSNLRSLRHPPRLRGSRLERVLRAFSSTDPSKVNLDYCALLSGIEGRSSKLEPNALVLKLRGVNHLKLILQQGQLMQVKTYTGEVENRFEISAPNGSAT